MRRRVSFSNRHRRQGCSDTLWAHSCTAGHSSPAFMQLRELLLPAPCSLRACGAAWRAGGRAVRCVAWRGRCSYCLPIGDWEAPRVTAHRSTATAQLLCCGCALPLSAHQESRAAAPPGMIGYESGGGAWITGCWSSGAGYRRPRSWLVPGTQNGSIDLD